MKGNSCPSGSCLMDLNSIKFFKSRFSVSIFALCLLEFIFWSHAAGATAAGVGGVGEANNNKVGEGVADAELQEYLTRENENLNEMFIKDPVQENLASPKLEQAKIELKEASKKDTAERATEAAASGKVLNNKNNSSPAGSSANGTQQYSLRAFFFGGVSGIILLLLFPLSRTRSVRKAGDLLLHPWELLMLLQFKFIYSKKVGIPKNLSPAIAYCYEKLVQTSRSFSAVILELPDELREVICNFYLVLRALDTVEDDMTVPVPGKVKELEMFYEHLYDKKWTLQGYGTVPAERDMLENFYHITEQFSSFKPEYQEIIADITKRMGKGMAEFAQREVVTVADYNLYCHYVAGLVGIGLSRLFAASGLESPKFREVDEIANSMGLFLQKTNITRDYLEDITAANSRIFYPKEIWGKYTDKLINLKEPEYAEKAVQCLNEMVTNALAHVPDCVDYMKMIKNQAVFKFCAIPQAMAIATLTKLYNNHDVFTRTDVKIRKGEAVDIIMRCTDFKKVCEIFLRFVNELQGQIKPSDPSAQLLKKHLACAKEKLTTELAAK